MFINKTERELKKEPICKNKIYEQSLQYQVKEKLGKTNEHTYILIEIKISQHGDQKEY